MKHQIFYEPHPVSPRRKAVLRAAGYRIIDARFAPDGADNPPDPEAQVDISGMKKAELIAMLAELNLPTDGHVATLRRRLGWAKGQL